MSTSRSRSGGRRTDGQSPVAQKAGSGVGGGGDEGILKALESHKRALKEAGARAKVVEDDANGWGDVSGIKHAAEARLPPSPVCADRAVLWWLTPRESVIGCPSLLHDQVSKPDCGATVPRQLILIAVIVWSLQLMMERLSSREVHRREVVVLAK